MVYSSWKLCLSPAALTSDNVVIRQAALKAVLDCNTDSYLILGNLLATLQRVTGVDCVTLAILKDLEKSIDCYAHQRLNGSQLAEQLASAWLTLTDQGQIMVIEDIHQDNRTRLHPIVQQIPALRFFAAAPLLTSSKDRVGSLFLTDAKPSAFGDQETCMLSNFAELLMRVLEGAFRNGIPREPVPIRSSDEKQQPPHQACALVDTSLPGWQILHADPAFWNLAGVPQQLGSGGTYLEPTTFWDSFSTASDPQSESNDVHPWEAYDNEVQSLKQFTIQDIHSVTSRESPNGQNAILRPAGSFKLDEDDVFSHSDSCQRSSSLPKLSSQTKIAPLARYGSLQEGSDFLKRSGSMDSLYFVTFRDNRHVTLKKRTPFKDLELQCELGTGGFGKIFKAIWHGREIAVKVVEELPAGFKEGNVPLEVVMMQAAKHPNVVRYMGYKLATTVSGKRKLWLLMEHCSRGTLTEAIQEGYLRKELKPGAPINLQKAFEILLDTARALTHLHSKDIIHCDISGGNILLHSDGQNLTVKVADFGLSRRMDVEYPARSLDGTYRYVAPEVLKGQPFTKESDVYSFGVMMYEMWSGTQAWQGLTNFQIVYQVLWKSQALRFGEDPESLFTSLAMRCMRRNPSDRPTFDQILLEAEQALINL